MSSNSVDALFKPSCLYNLIIINGKINIQNLKDS